MIITSRFLTCASSCAMTPSSSAGESRFMIPVVAQTVALFCERPSAKALGIVRLGDGDLRLGQVGLDAEALDHRVQLGRLLRRDLARAHRVQRELVGREQLKQREAAADQQDHRAARARPAMSATAKNDVERAEQEQREQHPGLEARVASELGLGDGHGSILANRLAPARRVPSPRPERRRKAALARLHNAGVRLCRDAGDPRLRASHARPRPSRSRGAAARPLGDPAARAPPASPPSSRSSPSCSSKIDQRAREDRPQEGHRARRSRPRSPATSGASGRLQGQDRRRCRPRQDVIEVDLDAKRAELERLQADLRAERARLVRLRKRLDETRAMLRHAARRDLQGRQARPRHRRPELRRLRRPARAQRVHRADLRPGPQDRHARARRQAGRGRAARSASTRSRTASSGSPRSSRRAATRSPTVKMELIGTRVGYAKHEGRQGAPR